MKDILPIILVCLFFVPVLGHAQQKHAPDSLLHLYNLETDGNHKLILLAHLYNAFLYSDWKQSFHYARQELQLAQKLNDTTHTALAFYHIGVLYNNADKADSARYYYLLAEEIFQQTHNISRQLEVKHALAILAYEKGNYSEALAMIDQNIQLQEALPDKISDLAMSYDLRGMINLYLGYHTIALENSLTALNLHSQIDEPLRKADVLNHLAGLEMQFHHLQKSIDYNLEALKIYEAYNDKYYQAQATNDIGNVFFYQKNYPEAQTYLLKSISLARESGSRDLEATALGNLGKLYRVEKKYTESLNVTEQSLNLLATSSNIIKKAEALIDRAMTRNDMNQPEKAIPLLTQAVVLTDSISAKDNLRQAYFNRAKSYEMIGDYRQALKDYQKFDSISSELYNETRSRQIEEMRTIYETEKKEKALLVQENENEILRRDARLRTLQIQMLIAGTVLLIGMAALLFIVYRQRVIRQKMIQEEDRKALEQELEFRRRELTTHALHLVSKNKLLNSLKNSIEKIKTEADEKTPFVSLIGSIDQDLRGDAEWENFEKYFRQVYSDFDEKIKRAFSELTGNEIRMITLMKMNLSTKEIATILNITPESVIKARYRLRKKLNLDTDQNLQQFILAL
ncbi:MAG: tetratricopeptide repeat protein [Bacteroidia bacterium]|nr:tetratricopeptide repeat protein [Bacteroidia bacterium]